jgi:hypothetical protein
MYMDNKTISQRYNVQEKENGHQSGVAIKVADISVERQFGSSDLSSSLWRFWRGLGKGGETCQTTAVPASLILSVEKRVGSFFGSCHLFISKF